MKKLCLLLAALLLLSLCSSCTAVDTPEDTGAIDTSASETRSAFPYTFTDTTGAEITMTGQPKTVAVLLSSLADVWVSAGGTVDITVGETVERGFADSDAILVDDGAGKTINTELLIASKPDLVIYSSELSGQIECADILRDMGIPTAGFRVDTFDEYLALLKICTDLLGTPEKYEENGIQVQSRIRRILDAAQARQDQPDILFVRAGSSAKYTKAKTAENHFVCIMLDELGTHNIADTAPILLDGLSTEEILLADPGVIFYTTMGDEASGVAYMDSLLADPLWGAMTAVKEGRVYQLSKELFQFKPNARWDEAYACLYELIYGEPYDAVEA